MILIAALLAGCNDDSSDNSNLGPGTGRGGSTARMTIVDDYLYAIANSDIQLFDISFPSAPAPWSRVRVAWDIETLFPYERYLLVGAESGMYILDNNDPANPTLVGDFVHAVARDPVVARDGYAYVTLRSGVGASINEMNVVDIRDVSNPSLVKTIGMQHPSGLSVDEQTLYVCDDIAGLKLFDLSDPANPVVSDTLRDAVCRDVIAHNQILYVITRTQLLQYDLRNSPPTRLSALDVVE